MNIRKLTVDEIECRVAQCSAKGCTLLLYKTARTDRAILDEIVGNLWQNDFKVVDGKMYGGIGIFDKELNQWLWRWDCGTESNVDKEKGEASDCFKRAGFKWGIGIELYTAPFIFISVDTQKNDKGKYELVDKFAKFSVKSIGYDENGKIKQLEIVDKNDNIVFKTGQKSKPKDETPIYRLIAEAQTLEKLKQVYETYKDKVQDKKTFTSLVNTRKQEIMKGNKNNE